MKADIVVTEEVVGRAIERLGEKHRMVVDATLWKDEARLRSALAGARSVVIRNQTQVTRELLEGANNLIAIGRVGVGLDNIDLDAAGELGIVVIAPLGANAVSVAEITMGLIIALARKIPRADRSTKAGQWDRRGCTGVELDGKTVALLGFGRIGKLVAARARAFGMRVVVYDPFIKKNAPELAEAGAILTADPLQALKEGDFVSAHLPLTSKTRRMIDATALGAMKKGAFFINTSRGGVVDEPALLAALQEGRIAGAALDVREVEPPVGANPFAGLENVILTPHIASFTVEAQTRTVEAVCADLDRVLKGEPVVNFVNFAKPRRTSKIKK